MSKIGTMIGLSPQMIAIVMDINIANFIPSSSESFKLSLDIFNHPTDETIY